MQSREAPGLGAESRERFLLRMVETAAVFQATEPLLYHGIPARCGGGCYGSSSLCVTTNRPHPLPAVVPKAVQEVAAKGTVEMESNNPAAALGYYQQALALPGGLCKELVDSGGPSKEAKSTIKAHCIQKTLHNDIMTLWA